MSNVSISQIGYLGYYFPLVNFFFLLFNFQVLVYKCNIFYVPTVNDVPKRYFQLTDNGIPKKVFNGVPDWVYEGINASNTY